jgi:signal transduction histidine kinase
MRASVNNGKTNSLKTNGSTIRGQLVLGFTLFAFIILIIVWIFQVLLLDKFYEYSKLSELKSVLNTIEYSIDNDDFDDICSELASQYDVCLLLYTVKEGVIDECIVDKEVSPTCVIHFADDFDLNKYYNESLKSGTAWTQRFSLTPEHRFDNSDAPHTEFPPRREKAELPERDDRFSDIAISVKALQDSDGNEYAAFINLRFTPVYAVQQTRNMQFGYITAGVILVAIFFAFLFSFRLARPLEKMTISAEQMASGDYSVEFKCEGYRETKRLASTLNYAVDQISKTDNLQRELIANISHDLRTPLTLITGYSEMMRDIPGENTPENSQLIIDETKRLTTLVNDMLDYSKYSSGFEVPNFTTFNLTDSVKTTMNRYNELVKAKGFCINFEYDREVAISADERMILQVIYNLLNNAVNYTGKDKTVNIRQEVKTSGKVRISICDTGDGIPHDKLIDIWDRYYKVDAHHKRAVTGSGLGLSIVSKLLQLHSASYGVESTEGKGSCFWFELPIHYK